MAAASVRAIKRDRVRVSPIPDAAAVIGRLPARFDHHNSVHPRRALGCRSPREYIADQIET
jgi:putative transposase